MSGNDQSSHEWQASLLRVYAATRLLGDEDIPAMLEKISRAETLGPPVDPTLWLEKHAAMELDRRMLEAALPLHRYGREMKAKIDAAEVRR